MPFRKASKAQRAGEQAAAEKIPPPPTEAELRAQDLARAKKDCDYPHGREGIVLHLSASQDVNFFNNAAHSLYVVTYQLSDPNGFNRLRETPAGIGQLLEGKPFDASALSTRPTVLQPGQQTELKLDRLENTRYVGVVAGYYEQQGQRLSRLYPIPTDKILSPRGVQMECTAGKLLVELTFEGRGIFSDR